MQEMEKGEVVEMREVEFGGFYFVSTLCTACMLSVLIVLVLNISEQLNWVDWWQWVDSCLTLTSPLQFQGSQILGLSV